MPANREPAETGSMSYAFTFDARACSGCKACQEACKDRNRLPAGVLWRRVIEVSGGEWQQSGGAWQNSVFAYNLSLACNHCVHPKCAGVCPVEALTVRPDGIVLLDSSRCMGCGYCAWVCPYGVPQYDTLQGVMGKCDLCCDELDAGLPPSCVAACPLRVLNVQQVDATGVIPEQQALWQLPASEHPFPLPVYSRTEPHLAIQPHPAMLSLLPKQVANREEILPVTRDAARQELPLAAFTLLAQMSAGLAFFSMFVEPVPLPVRFAIGLLLGAGGLVSFLHLGRKRNAWRAVVHLKKSWLSREVLLAGLFGSAWAVSLAGHLLGFNVIPPWLLATLGIGVVDSMTRIYRIKTVPAWNTWRTPAAFFLSAAALGALGMELLTPHAAWVWIAGTALVLETSISLSIPAPVSRSRHTLRLALSGLAVAGILLLVFFPQPAGTWLRIAVLLAAGASTALGRTRFYTARLPGNL